MKLARYRYGTEVWIGLLEAGDSLVPVAEGAGPSGPETLLRLAMAHQGGAGHPEQIAERHALASACLLAPVPEPPAIRSFPAGRPPFYFVNNASIRDPRQPVRCPPEDVLDAGPALAAVVGAHAGDADPEEGLAVIAGWLVVNEWSARHLLAGDRAGGLGPTKGRDFATTIGPLLVTADEFGAPPAQWSPAGVVRIGSRPVARIVPRPVPWGELVAHAAANAVVRPGDLMIVALELSPWSSMSGADNSDPMGPTEVAPDLGVDDGQTVSVQVDDVGVLESAVGAAALLG
jgi:hypothetical protein